MKLYIATIVKHDEYFTSHDRTFTAKSAEELANQVYDYLVEETPADYESILIECTNGNEKGEPLSQGLDEDLCTEWLVFTSIVEL